jgi:hypothetical protein
MSTFCVEFIGFATDREHIVIANNHHEALGKYDSKENGIISFMKEERPPIEYFNKVGDYVLQFPNMLNVYNAIEVKLIA